MKLSILVPYIRKHDAFFNNLKFILYAQMLPYEGQIELLWDDHEYDTIGAKRNRLKEKAQGEFLVFFDADDKPSASYIKWLMEAIESNCDCASLRGLYSVDGKEDGVFEHSIKYTEWRTNPPGSEIKYIRTPNHISLIRSSIAKQFDFPDSSWAEDHHWSKQIHASGLIKTEFYIPEIIYYYNKLTK
jgi:hypothetical protein